MQVAIIGAGIGGLSTYLWLKELLPHQEDHDIMIYESQQSAKPRVTCDNPDFTPVAPDAEGSTLILDPSGLKVLQRLGDEVFHNVVGTGAPISSHWYRSSRGFSLTNTPAGELEPERMTCVAISRQGLWNCLRRRIPDYAIQIAQFSEVVAGGSGKIIRFNDGTYSVTADVVIGADGVNSVVRKAVLGEQKYRELAPVYAYVSTYQLHELC
jgi:2-polyprenyl-6-methoxyphenol hydroxylase-like FAD-dependent oxidoreductase